MYLTFPSVIPSIGYFVYLFPCFVFCFHVLCARLNVIISLRHCPFLALVGLTGLCIPVSPFRPIRTTRQARLWLSICSCFACSIESLGERSLILGLP